MRYLMGTQSDNTDRPVAEKGHVFKTKLSKEQEKDDRLIAENFMAVEGMKLNNSSRLVRKEGRISE
jgi:hypothetical protein